jgi:hypothetical protein
VGIDTEINNYSFARSAVTASQRLPAEWYPLISGERRHFTLSRRVSMLAALVLGVIVLNYFAPGRPVFGIRILASTILVAGFYPTWRWLAGADRGLPFMPFISMVFVMYYSVGLFLLERYNDSEGHTIPHSWCVRALALALTALLLMFVAYYGSERLLRRIIPQARMQWTDLGHTKLMGVVLGFVGIVVFGVGHALHVPKAFEQFVGYLGDLSLVGIVTLFILQLTARLDRPTKLVLWCLLIPGRMLLGFAQGATALGLAVPLVLLFTYSTLRGRMPWRWLALGALAIFVIRPMMQPMRALTDKGAPLHNASEMEKLKLFLSLMMKVADNQIPMRLLVQVAASRLADILPFAIVVQQSPRVVPYSGGETYAPLLYKFVPRVLYPEKLKDETGQWFGHRYGLLSRDDHGTAFNLAQTIELYVNFGPGGILLGSLLFGVIYRVIHCVFVHPEMGFGALVAGLVLLARMFSIESDMAGVLGGELWAFVFIGLVNLVMDMGELRASAYRLRLR